MASDATVRSDALVEAGGGGGLTTAAGPDAYVGPRPYPPDRRLYGRDRELLALTNRLLSERLLLLYSPSGAGKTSLLQAQGGLRDRMAGEGFHLLPIVRVSHAPDLAAKAGVNRYLLSTLLALEPGRPEAARRDAESLAALLRPRDGGLAPDFLRDHFAGLASGPSSPDPDGPIQTLLVLDQFEELLTLDPSDEPAKREFMRQLGTALKDHDRWALFAMREDYLAALEPYLPTIPTRLSATFRLDFLGRDAARDAIVRPAAEFGVAVEDDAVKALIDELARIQVPDPLDGRPRPKDGPYVEPLHLQVVCESLWRVRAVPNRITARDLERLARDLGDLQGVTAALARYYDLSVRETAGEFLGRGVTERSIRNWFERALISPAGLRRTVLQGSEASYGLGPAVVDALTDRYLIRRDQRHASVYYELAHDRLVRPIRESNAAWRDHLPPLPRQAERWDEHRRESDLLRGKQLDEAERWSRDPTEPLTDLDREFLAKSLAARDEAKQAVRLRQRLWAIVLLSLGLVVALILVGIAATQSWRAQRLTAMLSMQQGLTYCDEREVGYGMLYMARSLGEIPIFEADLLRIIPIQLASWRTRLHTLGDRIEIGESVWAVASSPDGARFIAGSDDGKARLWDAANDRLVRELVHPGYVRAVAFSPDGSRILTGCDDGKARLWDAASGGPLRELVHSGFVRAVAFSHDGRKALTGSHDGKARLWDAASGGLLGELTHPDAVHAVAFSPDGETVLIGGKDGGAQFWRVENRQRIGPPLRHDRPVQAVAFSPDGKKAVTGSDDGKARLWDAVNGTAIGEPFLHREGVQAVAFCPDGCVILTGTYDGTARLWDVDKRRQIGPPLRHGGSVWAVAFGRDGETIVTGSDDGAVRVWHAAIRPPRSPLSHDRPVQAVAFSPDGRLLVTGSEDGTARLWHTDSGKLASILGQGGGVQAVAFSPDGNVVLTGRYDSTARLWDAASGRPIGDPLKHQGPVWAVAFGPRGDRFVTGSEDGKARLWDIASGRPIDPPRELPHAGPVRVVAFSPDGKKVATAGFKGRAHLWEADTGRPIGDVLAHKGPVWDLDFARDGTMLATASEDCSARLWDAASGRLLSVLEHRSPVFAVAFRPGGRAVLTGSADRTAQLWDTSSGRAVGKPLRHLGPVRDLAFDREGRTIITGSDDATAQLWDADSGQPLGPPFAHGKAVHAVAFGPHGRLVATASEDGNAGLWDRPAPIRGEPRRIAAWTRIVTGLELDEWGGIQVLDDRGWQRCCDESRRLGGPPD
jgi:WD40 repeat protein